MTYEKWKAYYDLAGKHPVAADLEHNVLFALGDWIADHIALEGCVRRLLRTVRDYRRLPASKQGISSAEWIAVTSAIVHADALLSPASSAEPSAEAKEGA
jgi:hypothetical protein